MEINIEVKRLKEIIVYLESEPQVAYNPYPDYDCRIYEVLHSLGVDKNYQQNHEKIKDKEINIMSLYNLRTMYTFIVRGERFSLGHIASFVDDKTILKLAIRELELIEGN